MASFFSLFVAVSAHATINVVDYWRMGESDPGAVAGSTPSKALDSAGTNHLAFAGGAAAYSGDVPPVLRRVSSLSVNLTNSAYAISNSISAAVDNFGIEAWVKPVSVTNGQILAYNGQTGGLPSSGWGLYVSGGNYSGLYGGVAVIGAGPAVPGVWTHVALVRSSGTATLYVNGIAAGTSTATPAAPGGNFALGTPPQSPTSQFYTGLMDEVRVFTFAAGQFSLNDLLLPFSPSSTNLVESSSAGTDFFRLTAAASSLAWTASTTNTWIHLGTTSGVNSNSYLVSFTLDANGGAARTGTILIGGQTVTVAQAGAGYAQASLTTIAPGLFTPYGVALDGANNVYIANLGNVNIKEWMATNSTVLTLISPGAGFLTGVALDGAGNVYFTDSQSGTVKKWSVTSHAISTLIPSGVGNPRGLALDSLGNIYIADATNNVIRKWDAASQTLSTLISSGLNQPNGVAVDSLGNVYIADYGNNAVKQWNPVSHALTPVIGATGPTGVAVDSAGNVYAAGGFIWKWNAQNQTVSNIVSGFSSAYNIAVDDTGSIYVADRNNSVVDEQPRAFVSTLGRSEPLTAGTDSLPPIVPANANLSGVFYPTSDQLWLTITGVTNGIISFSFTANNTDLINRTAHISVLGRTIAINQSAPSMLLNPFNLVEGPAAGVDSVRVTTLPGQSWGATSYPNWVHPPFFYATGNSNLVFTFDANPGATRIGTVGVSGSRTFTITQAGTNYVPAGLTTLVSSGLNQPTGVAVDILGDLYIADPRNHVIKKWRASTQTVTNLVSGSSPTGVAVDTGGIVYVGDLGQLYQWNQANNTFSTLVSSGLGSPGGLAVNSLGVTIADTLNGALKRWNGSLSTLASGLNAPNGVALNSASNSFIADKGNNVVYQRLPGGSPTVFFSGNRPSGVAVDSADNVIIANSGANAIVRWSAANQGFTTLVASGLSFPIGVAVDGAGNVYIADQTNSAIKELPRAFLDNSTRFESYVAGSGALPPVAPATANLTGVFQPTSDQPWLTITAVTNGVVNYAFTANAAATNRTAHINLLGVSVTVNQAGIPIVPPTLTGINLSAAGAFQFGFSNDPTATFTVLSSSNLTLPLSDWTVVGVVSNLGGGNFQFATPVDTNTPQTFYRVRSP